MLDTVEIKPRIRNVVSTADINQRIDITRLADLPSGIYDYAIYGGRCGYIKMPDMDGRVTVFPSGKMISVGGKSITKAKEQLNHAKFYMIQNNMAYNTVLTIKVRNIVATLDIGNSIPIDVLSAKISGATYDPETFPGMIIKGICNCSYLVFASGKIVIAGTRSANDLRTASFDIVQQLDGLLK